MKTKIRYLLPAEVSRARKIAKDGYPDGEAPTTMNLANLHKVAYDLFLGFFEDEQLVSFICASRYYGCHVKAESYETHMPNGETVIIHSICTHRSRRRRGIALALLRVFVKHIQEKCRGIGRILLICHADHIPLFTRAGFVFNDRVGLYLGPRAWYELEYPVYMYRNFSTIYTENDDVMSIDTVIPSTISTWTSTSSIRSSY